MMYAIIFIVRPIPTIRIQEPQEKKLQIQKKFQPAVTCCRQTSVLSFIQAIAKKYRFYAVFNAKPRLMLQYVTTQNGKPLFVIYIFFRFFKKLILLAT